MTLRKPSSLPPRSVSPFWTGPLVPGLGRIALWVALAAFCRTAAADELTKRMEIEARRSLAAPSGALEDTGSAPDSFAETMRAREAEQILTRAVHRTLEDRLESLLRFSSPLGRAAAWLEGSSRGGSHDAPSASRRDDPAAPGSDQGIRFGVQIDAHPRFVLSTRFAGLRGRLDLPLLNEPMRLSIERGFGARGRAILSSSLDRDGHASTSVGISLRF